MIGFRFSLVLDFGLGAADGRAAQSSRRGLAETAKERTRRQSAGEGPHPGRLGQGPLEPDDFYGRIGEETFGQEIRW